MSKETVNRKYKDTVFRMLFREKNELLELYNGVNGTAYINPDELEVTTLENAIYMGMKNDVSCCIDMNLQLYEQQSAVNPNMPMRFVQYFSKQLEKLLLNLEIYSRKQIPLPTPKFFVFYNGVEEELEHRVMKLSDAYVRKMEHYALELVVEQYNINSGYNEELKAKCPTLMEYMQYVETVRRYREQHALSEAVERAVEDCIKSGILRDFLMTNKAEVFAMSIFEYDEEKHNKTLYAEGYEDGENAGYTAVARKMKHKGMTYEEICEITGLPVEEVAQL